MRNPLVTVLMSVYNGARFLGESIDSILGQSYGDFEFLIIDDGSTDDSTSIIADYDDPRIRLQKHPNRGLAESLRQGILDARGEIIVRADQDDISRRDRLEKQVIFFDRHPRVGLLRSLLETIDAQGRTISRCIGETSAMSSAPRWWFLWRNIGSHSSAAFRKSILMAHDLNYRPGMDGAEDYDLWSRLIRHTAFGVVDEPLVKYRIHTSSMMQSANQTTQKDRFARVVSEAFDAIGVPVSSEIAADIAVLSGQTLTNPARYSYPALVNSLHILATEAAQSLEAMDQTITARMRATQLLLWARYLASSSRPYALQLLKEAIRFYPRVVASSDGLKLAVQLIFGWISAKRG